MTTWTATSATGKTFTNTTKRTVTHAVIVTNTAESFARIMAAYTEGTDKYASQAAREAIGQQGIGGEHASRAAALKKAKWFSGMGYTTEVVVVAQS